MYMRFYIMIACISEIGAAKIWRPYKQNNLNYYIGKNLRNNSDKGQMLKYFNYIKNLQISLNVLLFSQSYLGELAVREDIEGHGVGNALVKACEEWSRNQGYTLLVLDTGIANEQARYFYQRLGFQEESIKLTKLL